MMMDMSTMGSGMMLAMGIYHLAVFIFAVLGIAASIKYLRFLISSPEVRVPALKFGGHRDLCFVRRG